MRIFTLLKTAFAKIKSLSAAIDAIDDYVVEQGISSGWTYRKWNSGICEAWKKTTSTNFGTEGSNNGWYYRRYQMALPSGLFKTVTVAHGDCYWGTGLSWASARSMSTSQIQFLYMSNQNGGSGYFYHTVIGTWK